MTSRLSLGMLVLTSLSVQAAPEVLVSVVSSRPGWKEVTGKIADELKRRHYAVRLGADVIDRGKIDSWSKLASVNKDQAAALGIVVLLPEAVDQPTLVFVADRVTGKGLQRIIPPSADLTSSTVALAAVELLEASLIELYTEHATIQHEVPKPADLPMPEVPAAPTPSAWSMTLGVAAWWPIRMPRPTDCLRLGLHRRLGESLSLGFELSGSAIGESSLTSAGTVLARPFGVSVVLDVELADVASWRFGVAPFVELSAVVTRSTVLDGYRANDVIAPMVSAGARLELLRAVSDAWSIGLSVGGAGVITGPVLQVEQASVLDFTKAVVSAGVRVQYRL